MSIGDAHISKKHCNFFVNKGNALNPNGFRKFNLSSEK